MDACKGCGICAEMCPVEDIVMELEGEPEKSVGRHASEEYPSSIGSSASRGQAPDDDSDEEAGS